MNRVIDLAIALIPLSLLSFGGANVAIPEIQRLAVSVNGWVTDREFADLYAIAQAAPGPSILPIAFIGWRADGILGAIVSTVCMTLPATLVSMAIASIWSRARSQAWTARVERALAPIAVGLLCASALVLASIADRTGAAVLVTVGACVAALSRRMHPLAILSLGAAIGASGLLNVR